MLYNKQKAVSMIARSSPMASSFTNPASSIRKVKRVSHIKSSVGACQTRSESGE
jgi:hypothetical protein